MHAHVARVVQRAVMVNKAAVDLPVQLRFCFQPVIPDGSWRVAKKRVVRKKRGRQQDRRQNQK